MDKVPYMIIVGDKEQTNKVVSVRKRDAENDKQDLGQMSLEEVIELLKNDSEN